MANLNSRVTAHNLSPPPTNKPITEPKIPSLSSINFSLYSSQFFTRSYPSLNSTFLTNRKPYYPLVKSLTEDRDVITSQTSNSSYKEEEEEARIGGDVEGENPVRFDGSEDSDKFVGRAINATIVLTVGSLAITKLLTIDHEYWQGWTLYEVLRYAPEHNWVAYEEALKTHPVLAKMVISGVVYSVGDWIAQCYEGKPLFEFDRTRLFRSGLVGFSLHGFLSHYYYQFCEALFPSKEWWVVLAKVAFDQTVWAAVWNSIYYVALGFLRLESPGVIFNELKLSFLPLLTLFEGVMLVVTLFSI